MENGERLSVTKPEFSITGIPPEYLDFETEYPVLAINFKYTHTANTVVRSRSSDIWSAQRPVYLKELFFLIADAENRFRWLSPGESSFYLCGLLKSYAEHNRRFARYSIEKESGAKKNMINPVRPFSITGIEMDGFNPQKEYPVLAIDMDQYIPENQDEEAEEKTASTGTQSIAFFLVGDDNGEFAWIAEDECRLYPLLNRPL